MGLGEMVDRAINHTITEVVDVDGVVRQIDFNKVLEKIHIDELVIQRIDWNRVLATIDWDTQLQRIDFDAVIERVDTNAILARSSTGIFSNVLDSIRTTVVLMDLYLWVVSRCNVWCQHRRQRCYLPPKPPLGRFPTRQRDDLFVYPKGRTNKAVAVQGRYCGFVTKMVAIMIDTFLLTILFGAIFRLAEWSLVLFLNDSHDEASEKTSNFRRERTFWMFLLYCVYWFFYFFISVALAGQTPGMVLVGVRVVNCSGKANGHATVSGFQALVRTCLLPVTLTLCWPLGFVGVYRRDGRMLHDLVAQTGMIYLWDAKLAKVRQQHLREDNGLTVVTIDDDDSDAMDDYLNGDSSDDEENAFVGQEVVLKSSQTNGDREGSPLLGYTTFPTSTSEHRVRSNRITC